MSKSKPSLAGVCSTGLEFKRRPEPVKTETQQIKVTTQRPNTPTPSNRGYA